MTSLGLQRTTFSLAVFYSGHLKEGAYIPTNETPSLRGHNAMFKTSFCLQEIGGKLSILSGEKQTKQNNNTKGEAKTTTKTKQNKWSTRKFSCTVLQLDMQLYQIVDACVTRLPWPQNKYVSSRQ